MSLSVAYNTARSSLQASQSQMAVVSRNTSGASDPELFPQAGRPDDDRRGCARHGLSRKRSGSSDEDAGDNLRLCHPEGPARGVAEAEPDDRRSGTRPIPCGAGRRLEQRAPAICQCSGQHRDGAGLHQGRFESGRFPEPGHRRDPGRPPGGRWRHGGFRRADQRSPHQVREGQSAGRERHRTRGRCQRCHGHAGWPDRPVVRRDGYHGRSAGRQRYRAVHGWRRAAVRPDRAAGDVQPDDGVRGGDDGRRRLHRWDSRDGRRGADAPEFRQSRRAGEAARRGDGRLPDAARRNRPQPDRGLRRERSERRGAARHARRLHLRRRHGRSDHAGFCRTCRPDQGQ